MQRTTAERFHETLLKHGVAVREFDRVGSLDVISTDYISDTSPAEFVRCSGPYPKNSPIPKSLCPRLAGYGTRNRQV